MFFPVRSPGPHLEVVVLLLLLLVAFFARSSGDVTASRLDQAVPADALHGSRTSSLASAERNQAALLALRFDAPSAGSLTLAEPEGTETEAALEALPLQPSAQVASAERYLVAASPIAAAAGFCPQPAGSLAMPQGPP